jgi:hypothetical protein
MANRPHRQSSGPRILTSNALTGQQPKQLLNLGKAGLAFGLLLAYSQ